MICYAWVLFGKKNQILSELKHHNVKADNFEIVDCSKVIDMGEHPTKAFKSKPDSSIAKGFGFLSAGKIDGFASAGNTGAMFVGGYYSVKAIEGILRPAISTLVPRIVWETNSEECDGLPLKFPTELLIIP